MNDKPKPFQYAVSVNNSFTNNSFLHDDLITLEEINMEQFHYQLPAIIYSIFLMIIGTPGNIIVLYVYFLKWRKSTSRMFILFLTAMDLVNCVTTIPMEIFVMRYSVMLDRPWLCKISRFSTYTMNSSSAAILVAIAVDRFKRICRPHGPQFSARTSKYICVFCICLALTLTWPALLFYGTRKVSLKNVEGKACLLENKFDLSVYPHVYFVVMMASTIVIFTTLSVLYYFVGLQVCKHRKMRRKRKKDQRIAQSLAAQEQSSGKDDTLLQDSDSKEARKQLQQVEGEPTHKDEIKNEHYATPNEHNKDIHHEHNENPNCLSLLPLPGGASNNDLSVLTVEDSSAHSETRFNATPSPNLERKRDKKERREKGKNGFSKKKICLRDSLNKSNSSHCMHLKVRIGRSTLMLFLITLAYIISFLPFYVIAIIRQTDSQFISQLNKAGYMTYHVCLRSYLLSSAVNPIIYSFCNAQFRAFCFDMVKRQKRLSGRRTVL